MKRSIILLFCVAFLIIAPAAQAATETTGPWGAGIHYGAINNFHMFADADTDAGSVIAVDYSYDFTDRYTAALELGYIFDNYVTPVSSSPRYVETGAFLNIAHKLYMNKSDGFSPYCKLGTGLFTVTQFKKEDNTFTFLAATTLADISCGMGADFKAWDLPLNADLTLPALGFSAFTNARIAYIFTVGYKQGF